MLWTYTRANHTLHIEATFDPANKEFRLVIRRFDGTEHVETFADMAAFQTRLVSLERQLEAENWQTESAVAMHDGWKL